MKSVWQYAFFVLLGIWLATGVWGYYAHRRLTAQTGAAIARAAAAEEQAAHHARLLAATRQSYARLDSLTAHQTDSLRHALHLATAHRLTLPDSLLWDEFRRRFGTR